MPMLAGVGLLVVCCSSSSAMMMMGGSKETPAVATKDTTTPTPTPTPTTPSVPDPDPEVFWVGGYEYTKAQAAGVCTSHGAVVATNGQLTTAQAAGADWCATGWLSDHAGPRYPITTNLQGGCGNGSAGIKEYLPPAGLAGVNCYGIKPEKVEGAGAPPINNWNSTKWSRHE